VTIALVILAIVAALALMIGLVLTPLFLPWPQRLRWVIASGTMADPICTQRNDLREVHITGCYRVRDDVRVWLSSPGSHVCTSLLVPATAETLAAIDRWSVERTPLLSIAHADGTFDLHAPGATISGLRPVGSDLAQAA
jgi:hypothetical protein